MTRVEAKIRRLGGGFKCSLIMSGHATPLAEVCAAASALAYAFGGYAVNTGECEGTPIFSSGKAEISGFGGEGLKGAFLACVIGLLQLEEKYPESVSVELDDGGEGETDDTADYNTFD